MAHCLYYRHLLAQLYKNLLVGKKRRVKRRMINQWFINFYYYYSLPALTMADTWYMQSGRESSLIFMMNQPITTLATWPPYQPTNQKPAGWRHFFFFPLFLQRWKNIFLILVLINLKIKYLKIKINYIVYELTRSNQNRNIFSQVSQNSFVCVYNKVMQRRAN